MPIELLGEVICAPIGCSEMLGREVACESVVEKVPMESMDELEVDRIKWADVCAAGLGAGRSRRSSGP